MPRKSSTNNENGTPTTTAPKPTNMIIEVFKKYACVTNSIATLHRANMQGETVPCPTGDETTCAQCQTLRMYQSKYQEFSTKYNWTKVRGLEQVQTVDFGETETPAETA